MENLLINRWFLYDFISTTCSHKKKLYSAPTIEKSSHIFLFLWMSGIKNAVIKKNCTSFVRQQNMNLFRRLKSKNAFNMNGSFLLFVCRYYTLIWLLFSLFSLCFLLSFKFESAVNPIHGTYASYKLSEYSDLCFFVVVDVM